MIMSLFEKHKELVERAVNALHERTFFAAYPEHPSPKVYGETADEDGRNAFKNSLGNQFNELSQGPETGWVGTEESPYTQDLLNITYPEEWI